MLGSGFPQRSGLPSGRGLPCTGLCFPEETCRLISPKCRFYFRLPLSDFCSSYHAGLSQWACVLYCELFGGVGDSGMYNKYDEVSLGKVACMI